MTTHELGVVAVATIQGVEEPVRVFRTWGGWAADLPRTRPHTYADHLVTDVRPLVVLDLQAAVDHFPADKVASILRIAAGLTFSDNSQQLITLRRVADQIEAQVKPRVLEPAGLGAVVRDSDGDRWVRSCPIDCEDGNGCIPWSSVKTGTHERWSAIDAAEVLGEGLS